MIPRFNLYGVATQWDGNIQQDIEGAWLLWKDTEAYVEYALANGYIPTPVVETTNIIVETPSERVIKYEQGELFPTDDIPEDNNKDLVEFMENKVESIED